MAKGLIEYLSSGSEHHTRNLHRLEETYIQRRRLEYIPRNTELRVKFRHAITMRNLKKVTQIFDTERNFRPLQTLPSLNLLKYDVHLPVVSVELTILGHSIINGPTSFVPDPVETNILRYTM